jgi:hypothetical protein
VRGNVCLIIEQIRLTGNSLFFAPAPDAAQERGEASTGDTLRKGPGVPKQNAGKATAADVGLSRKEIHEEGQSETAPLGIANFPRLTALRAFRR